MSHGRGRFHGPPGGRGFPGVGGRGGGMKGPMGGSPMGPPVVAAGIPGGADAKRHHEHFQILLQDMGLDFKSYQGLCRGDNSAKVVSNQFVIQGEEALSCAEPTLGLLILVLHSAQHTVGTTCAQWLRLYRDIQQSISQGILSTPGAQSEPTRLGVAAQNHSKIADMAAAAVRQLDKDIQWDQPAVLAGLGRHQSQDYVRKLFVLLDEQSGLRGQNQSPSTRRVQSDPKGMLCNLFLTAATGKSAGGCQQGFLCNQIHISPQKGWENRKVFFTNLAAALLERGVRPLECEHRIKDAILYAKYANKVSLKVHGGFLIFFKTAYSRGRLLQAKGGGQICPGKGIANFCPYGENCEGVHIADNHSINAMKSSEPLDPAVFEEVETEAAKIMANVKPANYVVPANERRASAAPRTDTPPTAWAAGNWNGTNAPREIDPKLLDQLAGVSRSPVIGRGESMTPVFDELYRHGGFESGDSLHDAGDSPVIPRGSDTPIHVSGGPGANPPHPSLCPVKLPTE